MPRTQRAAFLEVRLQGRLARWFGGQTGSHIFRLLQPQLVSHAALSQAARQRFQRVQVLDFKHGLVHEVNVFGRHVGLRQGVARRQVLCDSCHGRVGTLRNQRPQRPPLLLLEVAAEHNVLKQRVVTGIARTAAAACASCYCAVCVSTSSCHTRHVYCATSVQTPTTQRKLSQL